VSAVVSQERVVVGEHPGRGRPAHDPAVGRGDAPDFAAASELMSACSTQRNFASRKSRSSAASQDGSSATGESSGSPSRPTANESEVNKVPLAAW
jgi:hypothetical protein